MNLPVLSQADVRLIVSRLKHGIPLPAERAHTVDLANRLERWLWEQRIADL